MYCPSCGKEIPDHSTFCLGCGKPIQIAAKPNPAVVERVAPLSRQSRYRPLTLFLIFLLVFVVWRAVNTRNGSASLSLLHPYSKPLLSGSVAVAPLRVQYWRFDINPTMTNSHVTGTFHATGGSGNDIEAVVAEWGECENWINGHQAQVLYTSGKVTNGTLDVPIHKAGTYCLAFSNKMALLSGKTIFGDIALQYLLP